MKQRICYYDHTHTHTHTRAHTHMYMHTLTHMHKHAHTHTHTHRCRKVLLELKKTKVEYDQLMDKLSREVDSSSVAIISP